MKTYKIHYIKILLTLIVLGILASLEYILPASMVEYVTEFNKTDSVAQFANSCSDWINSFEQGRVVFTTVSTLLILYVTKDFFVTKLEENDIDSALDRVQHK